MCHILTYPLARPTARGKQTSSPSGQSTNQQQSKHVPNCTLLFRRSSSPVHSVSYCLVGFAVGIHGRTQLASTSTSVYLLPTVEDLGSLILSDKYVLIDATPTIHLMTHKVLWKQRLCAAASSGSNLIKPDSARVWRPLYLRNQNMCHIGCVRARTWRYGAKEHDLPG